MIESSFHQVKLFWLTWPGVKPVSYIYGISRLIHALGNKLCVHSQLLCMKNTLKFVKLSPVIIVIWLFYSYATLLSLCQHLIQLYYNLLSILKISRLILDTLTLNVENKIMCKQRVFTNINFNNRLY